MFDSTYISCPVIGFDHLLIIVNREFNLINGHPQYDVQYPRFATNLTDEELDIIHEMEDQDGCQEWRKGFCSCDECSELVECILDQDEDERFI